MATEADDDATRGRASDSGPSTLFLYPSRCPDLHQMATLRQRTPKYNMHAHAPKSVARR